MDAAGFLADLQAKPDALGRLADALATLSGRWDALVTRFPGLPFWRCRAMAEHGDHGSPWSRGGLTDMGNCVAACSRHNIAKSAKVPTFLQTWRLARRRRTFFPTGQPLLPGERFAR